MICDGCDGWDNREEVPAEPRRVVVTLDSSGAPTVPDAFPRWVSRHWQGERRDGRSWDDKEDGRADGSKRRDAKAVV